MKKLVEQKGHIYLEREFDGELCGVISLSNDDTFGWSYETPTKKLIIYWGKGPSWRERVKEAQALILHGLKYWLVKEAAQ